MKVFNFNNSCNLLSCLLWQYDKAENLQSLVQSMQNDFDGNTRDFWNNWYTNVFNIKTANTFGLQVWGATLGVERPSYLKDGVETPYSDNQYRLFMLSRALLFNMDGSIYQINRYMGFLFPGKAIIVQDGLDMTINYLFYYDPTPEELTVLQNIEFLPRPSGVNVQVSYLNPNTVFGFEGSDLSNFDNGTFFA